MPTITSNLSLATQTHGQETILTATGQLDADTAPQLRATLADLIDSGHHRLVLDLTAASSCTSTGLAVIIHALKRILRHDANGHIFIACHGPVLKAFQHTGLTKIFPVHTRLAEALSDALAAAPTQRDARAGTASSSAPHQTRRPHTITRA